MELGGAVVNEWPESCLYWNTEEVRKFMTKNNYIMQRFDGCRYNLLSTTRRNPQNPEERDPGGEFVLIKKTWMIAVSPNADEFGERLNKMCPNDEEHVVHQHAKCAAEETKLTENYTWDIAREVHIAFKEFCNRISDESTLGKHC